MINPFILGLALGLLVAAVIIGLDINADWRKNVDYNPKVKLTVTDPKLAADPLVQRWLAMAQVQIEAEFVSRHQAEFDRRWTHKELGKIQVIPEMPDTVEPCDAGPWGPCPRPSACTCPPRERP